MSSSGNYRMNLVWASHGEQLRADINAIQSKLTGLEGTMSRGQRATGAWSQQMRAFGTTIRYALAASLVYGVATAVSSLGDFEAKLGEIDSLAAKLENGHLVGLGQDLEDLGDHALSLSNKWGVAVMGIQDSMRAFYSSGFLNTSTKQAKEWADVMTQVAMITENADPAKMAIGVAGMVQFAGQSGQPATAAAKVRDIIGQVLQGSTAFRGEDIVRDIGRLSGAMPALNMTPEEIFAVYGTAGMGGGGGAIIGRGIAQLLTASLANPKTKKQKEAFAQLGLPTNPDMLRQMGGYQILMQMLKGIGPVSITQKGRSALAGPGGADMTDEEALAVSGIPKTKISLLYGAIGRMESVRQVLSLLALGGPDAINKFLDSIKTAEKYETGKQRADIVNQRRWYQQMSAAQANARMQLVRGFEPMLRPLSRAVKYVSDLTIGHQTETAAIVGGVAAASLASKMLFRGGAGTGAVGRVLRRFPGLGGTAARASEMAAATVVGAGTGIFTTQGRGTHSDPIWVVIDPLSWFMPGAPNDTVMGSNKSNKPSSGRKPPTVIPTWLKGLGLGTAAVATFDVLAIMSAAGDQGSRKNEIAKNLKALKHSPLLRQAYINTFSNKATDIELQALQAWGRGAQPQIGERMLRAAKSGKLGLPLGLDALFKNTIFGHRPSGATGVIGVGGEVVATIELVPTDGAEKLIKGSKVHVKIPVGSTGGARPQHRGKRTTQPGSAAGR